MLMELKKLERNQNRILELLEDSKISEVGIVEAAIKPVEEFLEVEDCLAHNKEYRRKKVSTYSLIIFESLLDQKFPISS